MLIKDKNKSTVSFTNILINNFVRMKILTRGRSVQLKVQKYCQAKMPKNHDNLKFHVFLNLCNALKSLSLSLPPPLLKSLVFVNLA